MACCLTAQSYRLNQCWPIINEVLWHSQEMPKISLLDFSLKITDLILQLPGASDSCGSWIHCMWCWCCYGLCACCDNWIYSGIEPNLLHISVEESWLGHGEFLAWKHFSHYWAFVLPLWRKIIILMCGSLHGLYGPQCPWKAVKLNHILTMGQ